MCAIGGVNRRAVAHRAVARRGREQQCTTLLGQRDQRVAEGDQPLGRRGARAKRRRATDEPLLEPSFSLVEQRVEQVGPAAKAPEQCPLANARLQRHPVHGDRLRSPLGE